MNNTREDMDWQEVLLCVSLIVGLMKLGFLGQIA